MFYYEVRKTKGAWNELFSKCLNILFAKFLSSYNSFLVLFYCDEYKKSEILLLYQILIYGFRDVTLVYDDDNVKLGKPLAPGYGEFLTLPPRLSTPY